MSYIFWKLLYRPYRLGHMSHFQQLQLIRIFLQGPIREKKNLSFSNQLIKIVRL